MTRRLTPWLFILLLGVSPASAARLSSYEVGGFAGMFFGDAGVDDDIVYGVRANKTFGKTMQLELVWDRVETTFDGPTVGDLDEEFTSVAVHWMFNYPRPRSLIVPYFFIGIGTIEDEVDAPVDPMNPMSPLVTVDDDDTYLPFGGGFRGFVSNRVSIRGETRFKSFETFGVTQDSWELTVGVSVHLGGPR